jgi:hypothetical protein
MGQWSEITPREHEILREDVGLPPKGESLSLEELRPTSGRGAGKRKPFRKPQGKRARPAARRPGKRGDR